MSAILEVRDVAKRFGGVIANRGVTLDVPRGKIVGLIGPNGSGKTTLFNSIVGSHPIDAGSIRFEGREISRLRVGAIARLGLIRTFQQTRIYRGMSAMQNMQISTRQTQSAWRVMFNRIDAEDTEHAEQLLEFVGLYAKRHLLAEPAEHALYENLAELSPAVDQLYDGGDYDGALRLVARLRPAVDKFFDDVMVMADDAAVRRNRLELLARLHRLFLTVADLSRLQG